MLEEIVENEKHPPAETALAVLSFLQSELPAGGTAAERRFIRLYGPLCDRIFGKILGDKDNYRHKEGGWLAAQNAWPWSSSNNGPSGASQRPALRQQIASRTHLTISTKSNQGDPVVQLLGVSERPKSNEIMPPPTLIDAISKESENRPEVCFKFPFLGLPKKTQDIWLAVLESSLGGKSSHIVLTDNGMRLFGQLLRQRPAEQTELLRYRQKILLKHELNQHPGIQLSSPRGFQSSITPRQTSTPSKEDSAKEASPGVMLSMLEYYLFLFLRFPKAAPVPFTSSTTSRSHSPYSSSSSSIQTREPYGEKIYFDSFKKVLRHFLPYSPEDGRFISFGRDEYRQSELFLRILIALWIETQVQMEATSKILQAIQERKNLTGASVGQAPTVVFDLNNSYNLVQCQYDPPEAQILRCLRQVVIRLVADEFMSRTIQQRTNSWCLSPALTAMQQPFYNQVRGTFRHASIHSPASPFFSVFNAWLIWLEPWNIVSTSKISPRQATQRIINPKINETPSHNRTISVPKFNQKSKYTVAWEPYVAANLFMYTVPLAVFLRRARELDFSPRKFDSSVQLVGRVFRIFTPELVNVLNRLLSGSEQTLERIVTRHKEILGPFAPPPGQLSMASYKTDMHNLLDEIYMQHKKLVREQDPIDRMFGNVEGLFGKGVVQREGKALDSLLESARLIAQLPQDYTISQGEGIMGAGLPVGEHVVERGPNGELTEAGLDQIFTGRAKCNPADVIGDKTTVTSISEHEVAILVDLMQWLSEWLNEKTGYKFFNLRCMADYRNWVFLCIVWFMAYLVFKFVGLFW